METESSWIGYMKYDHFLTKKWYGYANGNFENVHETFVRSQTGLRVPLMKSLNATAQYNVDWDNRPTDGRVKTDRALLLTLGYSW